MEQTEKEKEKGYSWEWEWECEFPEEVKARGNPKPPTLTYFGQSTNLVSIR